MLILNNVNLQEESWRDAMENILEGRDRRHPDMAPSTNDGTSTSSPRNMCPSSSNPSVNTLVTNRPCDSTHSITYDQCTNNPLYMCCYKFLFELLLRYIPEYIHHYSSAHVIMCDVDKLLLNIYTHMDRAGLDNSGDSVSKGMYIAVLESKAFMDLLVRHGLSLSGTHA